ncbi:MAG: ABC transporter permease [Bacteroidetes bacterium]|nr:ABC transporter permease [Bacteroidota bacterium]
MSKIPVIIAREYLSRVRKKSFIIMTILGPVLMAAMMIVPVFMATMEGQSKKIGIIDETGLFTGKFGNEENMTFNDIPTNIETAKKTFSDSGYYALLYIPKTQAIIPTAGFIYCSRQPSLNLTVYIKNVMQKEVEHLKLTASGINEDVLNSIKTTIQLSSFKIDKSGREEKSYTEVSMVVGWVGGFLIYIFIFLYGSQVMRGVIEEKTNRIVEVIISSVKPFQLMMGKIVGVALVGLTQFLLWILLTAAIVVTFSAAFADKLTGSSAKEMIMTEQSRLVPSGDSAQSEITDISELNIAWEAVNSVNYTVVLGCFLFFFLGGYLLYASLFAAIGAAVDNEADTQQFMLPVTIPLIFALIMISFVINNPEGPAVFWLSIIPLTSPIIMMARIPFGVPYPDMILSVILLILGFLATTWMAGKIYRTGILMYGKKVSYRELWKWLKYRS